MRKKVHKGFAKSPDKSIALDEERLTREEQLKVIQWLVELKSTYEISDFISEEFCKSITPQAVKYKSRKLTKVDKGLHQIGIKVSIYGPI